MNDGKIGLSNLKIITEDGRELEVGKWENVGIDFSNNEHDEFIEDFKLLTDNKELTFEANINFTKKYHRKRKGKRYIITYYEEYSGIDELVELVTGKKLKHIKKVGESNG